MYTIGVHLGPVNCTRMQLRCRYRDYQVNLNIHDVSRSKVDGARRCTKKQNVGSPSQSVVLVCPEETVAYEQAEVVYVLLDAI